MDDQSKMGSGRFVRVMFFSLAATLLACGAPDDEPSPAVVEEDDGGTPSATGAGGSLLPTSSTSGAGGAGATSGPGGAGGAGGEPPAVGLEDVGTLVVLGDSIGDGGGQGPFYYDLLNASLADHFAKSIDYRNRAESGSKTSALVGQIQGLPSSLPGPVVVAITSGGNDMKDNLLAILTGFDGPARTAMGGHIDAALDALLTPDRFGAGVEVFVFHANIYDASDGAGDYQTGGCNIQMNSPSSTDPFFASWNAEIAARIDGRGQALVDMHGHFYGHGYHNPPKWYANDCTHPNAVGHDELARLFFGMITSSS